MDYLFVWCPFYRAVSFLLLFDKLKELFWQGFAVHWVGCEVIISVGMLLYYYFYESVKTTTSRVLWPWIGKLEVIDIMPLLEMPLQLPSSRMGFSFWANRENHQITSPVHCGAEDSVRLLITKNSVSFERFLRLWQTVGPVAGPSQFADFSLAFLKRWGRFPELHRRRLACTVTSDEQKLNFT